MNNEEIKRLAVLEFKNKILTESLENEVIKDSISLLEIHSKAWKE